MSGTSRNSDQVRLMVDDKGPLGVRFPDGLRDAIKSAAKANNRSMNAELVYRLEQSFETPRQVAPEIARLLDEHVQREVEARLMAMARNLSGGPQ